MADDAKGPAFIDFYFVIAHDGWGLILSYFPFTFFFMYVFTEWASPIHFGVFVSDHFNGGKNQIGKISIEIIITTFL